MLDLLVTLAYNILAINDSKYMIEVTNGSFTNL